jgi:hypothetical protein
MPPVTLMNPLSEVDRLNPILKEALDDLKHEFEEEEIASLMDKLTWGKVLEEMS